MWNPAMEACGREEMRSLQTEVTYEPASALFGGEDGLGFYRAITELWRRSLKMGGYLVFEFGDGQHEAVSSILKRYSFDNIQLRKDGGGIIRTAAAVKTGDDFIRYSDNSEQSRNNTEE